MWTLMPIESRNVETDWAVLVEMSDTIACCWKGLNLRAGYERRFAKLAENYFKL